MPLVTLSSVVDPSGRGSSRDYGVPLDRRMFHDDTCKTLMSSQPNPNPLHGVTLQRMIEHLVERYGWDGLGTRIAIRCFTHDPSVPSSLKFLRKTPWARAKVESLYAHSVAHPRKSQVPPLSTP